MVDDPTTAEFLAIDAGAPPCGRAAGGCVDIIVIDPTLDELGSNGPDTVVVAFMAKKRPERVSELREGDPCCHGDSCTPVAFRRDPPVVTDDD